MNYFSFLKRDYKVIFSKTWSYTTIVYTLISFVLCWLSPDQIISGDISLCIRIGLAISILVCVILIIYIIVGIYMYIKCKVLVFRTETGKRLYVQYGNVLDKNLLGLKVKKKIIVIPVNRCFDTIVDDDLVSRRTLHGCFMTSLYNTNKFDEDSLNATLQKYLKEEYCEQGEELKIEGKRKGNLHRFPVGTIAELPSVEDDTYFLLGLSKFDCQLTASTSREEFVVAVQKLVEYCYARSQGYPVVIPVFGIGLSRVSISKQEALNYIINAFKMNKNLIINDIHIVVHTADKKDVSIYNL